MPSDSVPLMLGEARPDGLGEVRAEERGGLGGGELRLTTPATAGSGVEGSMEPQRNFSPPAANARPGGIGEDGGGVVCLLPG